jgi:hypothetical protein
MTSLVRRTGEPFQHDDARARGQPPGRLLASRGPSGGVGPLSTLWRAVQELDHSARARLGSLARERGQLAELSEAVGLREITSVSLTIRLSCLAPNGG